MIMTEQPQLQHGQDFQCNCSDTKEAIKGNLLSLDHILEDIVSKLSHQLLGNCDVLSHLEGSEVKSGTTIIPLQKSDNPAEPVVMQVFQKNQINILIRSPLRLAIGRLNGLKKVIRQIEYQVSELSEVSNVK